MTAARDAQGVSYTDERQGFINQTGLLIIGKYMNNSKQYVEFFFFQKDSGNIMKFRTSEGTVKIKDGFISVETDHSEYVFKECKIDEGEGKRLMEYVAKKTRKKKK